MVFRAAHATIAIVLSLLPLPALSLLDHLNRGCGDGLCGALSGMLVLGALAIATLVFVRSSGRRKETPEVLRLVPFPLWALLLLRLVI